ncbi:MAG: hypothetical protein J6C98_02450 [Oscillospiraceae bacterium]|nr:hypothetical protein [Oscillospiraceae bacterium]
MTLFFLQGTDPGNNQDDPAPGTQESRFQTPSDQQPQAKSKEDTPPQLISAAHKNTPCTEYAEGV